MRGEKYFRQTKVVKTPLFSEEEGYGTLRVGDFDFFWILQGLGMEDPSFTIPHGKKGHKFFFWLMTVGAGTF